MGIGFSKVDLNEEATGRERIYFFVILVLVLFAVSRLLILPTMDVIKIRKIDIKSARLQIETLQKFINIDKKIEKPKKSPQVQKAVDERLERALGETRKNSREIIAEVISEITSRRRMGGVVLNSLSFKDAVARSGYTVMPVSLSVLGTYSALRNYLLMLEKVNFLFTVDNINFSVTEKNRGLISADIETSIYVGATGNVSVGG